MNENQPNMTDSGAVASPVSEAKIPQVQKPTVNQDIGLGRGVYISTYGCQMNVNDTERMYSLLEMANFSIVKTPEEATLIIINACSIREKPVHKVYSEVGRFKKLRFHSAPPHRDLLQCRRW